MTATIATRGRLAPPRKRLAAAGQLPHARPGEAFQRLPQRVRAAGR